MKEHRLCLHWELLSHVCMPFNKWNMCIQGTDKDSSHDVILLCFLLSSLKLPINTFFFPTDFFIQEKYCTISMSKTHFSAVPSILHLLRLVFQRWKPVSTTQMPSSLSSWYVYLYLYMYKLGKENLCRCLSLHTKSWV